MQGSAYWWAREHRAHHRYTDSELDPYSAKNGFLYTHLGWIVLKRERAPGPTDTRDLKKNKLVMWQHRNLSILIPIFGYAIPAIVPGYFWNDWAGGIYYAALLRLTVVQHVRIPLFLLPTNVISQTFAVRLLHQLSCSLVWRCSLR